MRMKEMMADKNDLNYLRNVGHVPELLEKELTVNSPYFFNKYGGPINIEDQYQDAHLFIVSNGPSLNELDLNLLKSPGVMTMSINNGAVTLLKNNITPNFWVCVDQVSRFVLQVFKNPGIMKFIPASQFDKELWDNEGWKKAGIKPLHCPNVVGYRRNEKTAFTDNKNKPSRWFSETSFNWGNHKKYGGKRTVLLPAIKIPYILGFRTIYLLGVDLDMSPDKRYHFEEGRTSSAISNNQSTYKRLIEEYGPGIENDSKHFGFKIYNCNPNSKLNCFEHIPFESAVSKVCGISGPTDNIQTMGMYLKWEEKISKTREQAIETTYKKG